MQFHEAKETVRRSWVLIAATCFVIAYTAFVLGAARLSAPSISIDTALVWKDNNASASLEDAIALNNEFWEERDTFTSSGIHNAVFWLKIALPKTVHDEERNLLEIANPLLDSIDVWFFETPNDKVPYSHQQVGDAFPFLARPYLYESFIFDLSKLDVEPAFAFVRVQTTGSFKVPMRVWRPSDFFHFVAKQRLVAGCFFGFLVAMAISNLFFFLTTRNVSFALYSAHVLSFTLVCASLFGYGYFYLWSNNPAFQQKAVPFFSSLTLGFALFFTHKLLSVEQHSRNLSLMLKVMGVVLFINALISAVFTYHFQFIILSFLLLTSVVLVLIVCLFLSLKNVAIARYYNVAWGMMLICSFAAVLDALGVFTLPGGINGTLLYSVAGETLLLAFVLALSYGSQGETLARTQAVALAAEKESAEAKDKLLELEQHAKDELEYKVQERTLELEITLRELSEANAELERINTVDPLTGIRNRRHFDKRLMAEGRRSRREQTSLCLVMLDIDHFKRINDNHGHDVGDVCIKHIATLAKSFVKRPSDDVCRYGGEEFVLVLPNTNENGAFKLVNDIRQAIQMHPCPTSVGEVAMTISAGVASGIVDVADGEKEILKRADMALYKAKQSGRNKVCTASELKE